MKLIPYALLVPCILIGLSFTFSETAVTRDFKVEVTLLKPGDEPRQELRYTPKAPGKYHLVLQLNSQIQIESEQDLFDLNDFIAPTLRLYCRVATSKMTDDGLIHQKIDGFKYEHLLPGKPTRKEIKEANKSFEELKKTKVEMVYDQRGRLLSIEHEAPEGTGYLFKLQFEDVLRALSTLALAVPEEPVGIGAEWQITQPAHIPFIKATETRVVRWVASENEMPKLEVTVTIAAEEQKHADYGSRRKRHHLLSLEHEETGQLQFDERFLQPVVSDFRCTEVMAAKAILQEGKTTATWIIQSGVDLSSTKAERLVPKSKPTK